MGMAASQARLLSITARVHDLEYQAQNIMNQKIALATQKDELYEEYCDALDAKKIQVAYYGDSGKLNFVDATYASVCGFNPDRRANFALTDANTGKLIVDQDLFEAYQAFQGKDKYAFALMMLGFTSDDLTKDTNFSNIGIISTGISEAGVNAANSLSEDGAVLGEGEVGGFFKDSKSGLTSYVIMNSTEAAVYEKHKDDASNNNLEKLMQKIESAKDNGDKKEVQKAIDAFRKELYSKYAGEIYESVCTTVGAEDLGEYDSDLGAEFNYYVQIFEAIESAGGCTTIEGFAKDGDTGNEWFNNMIKSGKAILLQYNDSGTKKGTWTEASVATSQNLQEVADDADLKKAEAKYEHELSIINRKDTKYDQDLKNLETERTALEKERDSVKQVKDDNIERTFGIFS